MKKTVIDELIEYKNQLIENEGDYLSSIQILNKVMLKAEELKEKHKQEIIKAYDKGMGHGMMDAIAIEMCVKVSDKTSEDYYNKTYLNE